MANVSNSTSQIGGIEYLNATLGLNLTYLIITLLQILIGTIGNLMVMGAVLCSEELKRSTTNTLVFNLAIADLVVSGISEGSIVAGILIGESFFNRYMSLCKVIASICLIACEASMMSILLLAFNRYIHICHHLVYAKVFSKQKTLIFCFITWLTGLLNNLPVILGWGEMYYDRKALVCLWNRLASRSYSFFLPMSSILTPSLLVLIFYARVFTYLRGKEAATAETLQNRDVKKSIKIAKTLFGSFIIFALCWTPYGFLVMADFDDRAPAAVHAFFLSLAHSNSIWNPIIYAFYSPGFKRGYRILISKFCRVDVASKVSASMPSKSQVQTNLSQTTP